MRSLQMRRPPRFSAPRGRWDNWSAGRAWAGQVTDHSVEHFLASPSRRHSSTPTDRAKPSRAGKLLLMMAFSPSRGPKYPPSFIPAGTVQDGVQIARSRCVFRASRVSARTVRPSRLPPLLCILRLKNLGRSVIGSFEAIEVLSRRFEEVARHLHGIECGPDGAAPLTSAAHTAAGAPPNSATISPSVIRWPPGFFSTTSIARHSPQRVSPTTKLAARRPGRRSRGGNSTGLPRAQRNDGREIRIISGVENTSWNGVSITPGGTAFTRMPCGPVPWPAFSEGDQAGLAAA